jgi:integrating conjugative element protein (TIGR03757 family)
MSLPIRLSLTSRAVLPLVLLGALCASAYAQTRAIPVTGTAAVRVITRVDVFVSDKTPIAAGTESQGLAAGGTLNLWNLDDMERFNARLALGLPRDMAMAAKQLAARTANLNVDEQALLSKAANGQSRADALSIERVPAVVVNETHVYYGARTIEEALSAYRSGR